MVAAAAAMRIPTVLTETDGRVGLANRLAGPLARRVLLAVPIAGLEGGRYRVVGRPVDPAFFTVTRAEARAAYGIADDEQVVARVRRVARSGAAQHGRRRGLRRGGSGRAAGAARDRARQARRHAAARPAAGVRVLRLDAAAAARRRPRASAAPAARCGRWPRPACRRSSCPGPAPRATTRRRNAAHFAGRRRRRARRRAGRRAAARPRSRRCWPTSRAGSALAAAMRELARPDAASDVADELLALAGTARRDACTCSASAASA